VIIDLLRFIHLTLPICAGIECQNIKQGSKRTKVGKRYLAMASRNPARPNISPWRANGELNGEHFQKVGKTGQAQLAMASNFPPWRNKAVSSDPYDVAETHWQRKLISPWRAKFRQAKCHFSAYV